MRLRGNGNKDKSRTGNSRDGKTTPTGRGETEARKVSEWREAERGKGACRRPRPPLLNTSFAAAAAGGRFVHLPPQTSTVAVMMPLLNLLLWSFYLLPFQQAHAQSISTSTPVPPLQWINLTNLLQGPSAPPLKDASIGYDNTTRTLIIFGGESQGGIPQQQTYLSVLPFLTFFVLLKPPSIFLQSQSRHPHLDHPLTSRWNAYRTTAPKKRRHRGW